MIIFFDLDDTLVFDNKLLEKNKLEIIIKWIDIFKNKFNISFGINTNRSIDDTEEIAKSYGILENIICESGSVTYKNINKIGQKKDKILDKIVNNIVIKFCEINKLEKIANIKQLNCNNLYINENRKFSRTIYLEKSNQNIFDNLYSLINDDKSFNNYRVLKIHDDNYLKLSITQKTNKFDAMLSYTKNQDVYLISNDEESTKIKSISRIATYNATDRYKASSEFYSKNENLNGILDCLNYIINKSFKDQPKELIIYDNNPILMEFVENKIISKLPIKQVSGYIFNHLELLIVNNSKHWTIPGGKPEIDETNIETLKREIIEESNITIKNIKKVGSVVVHELFSDNKYIQLRYCAEHVDYLNSKLSFETIEAKYINLLEIENYIKWSRGKIFQLELEHAKKINKNK